MVVLTFEEIKERLKREEECSLLELLDLTSEDIVERFQDIIEDRIEELSSIVQETMEDNSD